MARPARSSASATPAPPPVDPKSKKRKRETSMAGEHDPDRPLAKQIRSTSRTPSDEPTLSATDAFKLLTVLEAADSGGYLDRNFNVPEYAYPLSLRTVLRDASQHPISHIRTVLTNLLPLSSHARGLVSAGAAEQYQFFKLASDLLNQAADRSLQLNAVNKLLQNVDEELPETKPEERRRQYALLQRLPTGDWWTSATVPRGEQIGLTRAEASALATKQAELVAIIPSLPVRPEDASTLGSLRLPARQTPKEDGRKEKDTYLTHRKIPAPKILDWGYFGSFGPAYDSENAELGPEQTHEIVYESLLQKRARVARQRLLEKREHARKAAKAEHQPAVDGEDVKMEDDAAEHEEMNEDPSIEAQDLAASGQDKAIVTSNEEDRQGYKRFSAHEAIKQLQGVVSPEETEHLKAAFRELEVELGVGELLEQNAKALQKLIVLQKARLLSGEELKPESSEFQLALSIQKSLALILSLRPRTSTEPETSFLPPPAVLHTLHRSLPLKATAWRGTLAYNRPHALKDDTTVHVKPTARAQAVAAAAASSNAIQHSPVPSTPHHGVMVNGTPRNVAQQMMGPPQTPGPQSPAPFAMYPGYIGAAPGTPGGVSVPQSPIAGPGGVMPGNVIPGMPGMPGPQTPGAPGTRGIPDMGKGYRAWPTGYPGHPGMPGQGTPVIMPPRGAGVGAGGQTPSRYYRDRQA